MGETIKLILASFFIFESCISTDDIYDSRTDNTITEEYSVSTTVGSNVANDSYVDYNVTYEDYSLLDSGQAGYTIFTPEDIEAFLLHNDTVEFLSNFQTGYQRDVIRNQLKYCPYNRLCGFSFNLSNSWMACCQDCSCDLSTCVSINTCCPDILFNHLNMFKNTSDSQEQPTLLEGQSVTKECILLYMSINSSSYSAYGYSTCPVGTETELRTNCTRPYYNHGILEFQDTIPVIKNGSNDIYRNKYCALCHDVSADNFEKLEVTLNCAKTAYLRTDKDILDAIYVDGKCEVQFTSQHVLDLCNIVLSHCNLTGTFEETACSMYRSVININGYSYKNIFCSICNGILPQYVSCASQNMKGRTSQDFSLTGLLKLDAGDDSRDYTTTDIGQCLEHQLYDTILDSCKDMLCSDITVLKSGKCVHLFEKLEKITYIAFLRIKPIIPLSISDGYNVSYHVIAHMRNFLEGAELCGIQMIYKSNVSLNESDIFDSELSDLLYFDARVLYFVSKIHDPSAVVENIMEIHDSKEAFLIEGKNETVKFEFQVRDDENPNLFEIVALSNDSNNDDNTFSDGYKFVLLPNLIADVYEGYCINRNLAFNILELTTCPKVNIYVNDTPWIVVEEGIMFLNGRYVLKNTEYYFLDIDHMMVCTDKYKQYLNHMSQLKKEKYLTTESVVSIVCSAVSILALCLTFFVYCFFPKLRERLPGKNNMSLIFTLLCAQCLYLIGSFSDSGRNSKECFILGLLIHFSWLAALSWMNICTFHMFRVLTRAKIISASSGRKKMLIYHVYALSMAAIFIVINVCVSYYMYGDFGYGGEKCYISSQQMVIFTFSIPAALIVLSNLFMFAFVIIKIKRSPSVQKNVRNERNDIIVFAKLSTITGVTWIFGFLYMLTSFSVMSYLFIVFNASQGVFIMFAFVINKRVYDLLRGKVLGVTVTSSGSGQTKSSKL